jgi:hypothetical protein
MANPKIIPKKSVQSAKIPLSSDLGSGEICINHADKKLYAKHPSTGSIQEIGGMSVHSHDELYSSDNSQLLELQNNSNLTITAGGSTKTFVLPNASGTIATLSDISGSVSGVTSVNTRTGSVTLDKTDVGLGNCDNTSDANKPISTATQTALDSKASTSHPNLIAAPGTKTIAVFTPRNNYPPATAFATMDTRNSIAVLDFDDGATNESTTFCGVIPEAADLSTGLIVSIRWMATSATSGNCRWGAQWEKSGTDLDSDSFDSSTEAHTAAPATSGIEATTTLTCTALDSLAAGDRFRLRVYRDSSDTTNDTMTGDAELIAVEVRSAA